MNMGTEVRTQDYVAATAEIPVQASVQVQAPATRSRRTISNQGGY